MSKVMNPAEWLKGRYSKAQRRTTESGLSPIYSSREVVGLLEEYAANVAAHARQEAARQAVEIIRQHVFAVEGLHTADELCNSIMALTSGAGEKTKAR